MLSQGSQELRQGVRARMYTQGSTKRSASGQQQSERLARVGGTGFRRAPKLWMLYQRQPQKGRVFVSFRCLPSYALGRRNWQHSSDSKDRISGGSGRGWRCGFTSYEDFLFFQRIGVPFLILGDLQPPVTAAPVHSPPSSGLCVHQNTGGIQSHINISAWMTGSHHQAKPDTF